MKEKMHNTYFKSIKFSLILVSCVTIFNTITAGDASTGGTRRDDCDRLTKIYLKAKASGRCDRVVARGDYTDYLPEKDDDRAIEELVAAALAAHGSKDKGGNRIT